MEELSHLCRPPLQFALWWCVRGVWARVGLRGRGGLWSSCGIYLSYLVCGGGVGVMAGTIGGLIWLRRAVL